MKRFYTSLYFILLFFVSDPTLLKAAIIGSDILVSVQSLINFPQLDLINSIGSFAWMKNGFTLQNASTVATFDSVFPVSGTVNLNSGNLTLTQDLVLGYGVSLQGLGTITANNHSITFPRSVSSFTSTTNVFVNANIFFNNDMTVTSSMTFNGNCTLNGNGNSLVLGTNGYIIVGNGATLKLENCRVENVAGDNVQCKNSAGVLILEDVNWIQSSNFNFALGALQFKKDVVLQGDALFAYQTIMTSTVLANSMLTLDKLFTFSYDPVVSTDLIQFTDSSSVLLLNNNSTLHTTIQGMSLTKGSMIVNGDVKFESEITSYEDPEQGEIIVDNNINIGDGNSANDMLCEIAAGAIVRINQGSFAYRNVNASSWVLANSSSIIFVETDAALKLYQDLNMGDSVTTFANNAILGRASGADLIGSINPLGNLIFVSL